MDQKKAVLLFRGNAVLVKSLRQHVRNLRSVAALNLKAMQHENRLAIAEESH